jgi:ABC-2 type transport system ATP-binding protein
MDDLVNKTIGGGRRITLVFDAAADAGLADLGVEVADREATVVLNDVALELPDLLTRIRQSGRRVVDIHADPPSLQSVFIHLTGHELRE